MLFRRWSFKRIEYLLLRQTGFNLLKADVACPIFLLISLAISPSYSIQLPRYLNSLTCSIVLFLHFNMSGESDVAILFVLLTFTASPIFSAFSSMASSSSCSFASSRRTTSSAKSRLEISQLLIFTPMPEACCRI